MGPGGRQMAAGDGHLGRGWRSRPISVFRYRCRHLHLLQERSRSVRLLDRSGQVFATFGAYRAPLAVDALPPHLAAALQATETAGFMITLAST